MLLSIVNVYNRDDLIEVLTFDIHLEMQNGLQVYVDPKWTTFIDGLVIDYVKENLAGIAQKRLVFINPQEKNRCGCGESFTIE